MPFPITYNGKVKFKLDNIPELTPEILLEQLESGLKKAKAVNILRKGNSLSFSGGIRSMYSWSVLRSISSGKIHIESTDDMIIAIYHLRFTTILIFTILLMASIWNLVSDHFHGSILKSLLALCIIWSFASAVFYLTAVVKFSSLLRDIVKLRN